MKKVKTILEAHLTYEYDNRLWRVPLNNNATSDPYWKQAGVYRKHAIKTPGREDLINNSPHETIHLQRTGKTIVEKFAGFVANPKSVDFLVLLEDDTQMLITVLRTPRGDNVSAKEGYTVGIYDPPKSDFEMLFDEDYEDD